MRKYLIIILVLMCGFVKAQTPPRTGFAPWTAKWKFVNPVWLDSGAYITKIVKTSGQNRYLVYDSLTGKIGYRYVSVDFSNYVPYTGATTNVNIGANTYIGHSLKSDASDGVLIEAANGTDVGIFGAGNTANSSLYGGLTVGSLTSGNGTDSVVVASSAGLLKKRPASAFGSTYTAGRGLTLNSSTFRLDTTQFYTWTNARTRWNSAPTATSNYGVINFGSAAFDGVTSGYFVGSSSGTLMAGNAASGFGGDLINIQAAGSNRFKVASTGVTTINGSSVGSLEIIGNSSRSELKLTTGNYSIIYGSGTEFDLWNTANSPLVFATNNTQRGAWTAGGLLAIGSGVTSSFPALKRSTTTIEVRLADDSGYGSTQSLYDRFGSGSPESVVTAPVGAIYHRTDGGAGTSLYVKESGTGSTGWIAK